ncbi:heavy metal-responsive transcriptional regulator [Oleiagrimonas sp.]|jgi:MerR family copper efflux transcriptional regulator|uniref:heavy metal-responsive transcriptional regulator n=1 Tax=Oleiagrimonas sp. TaxID=2010330 RepID=UPI00260BB915|nr:heavy metal-responsive transcriptional regulator [Oleiagrimonas sp.]MDA3913395.1 heavy metal-responsive transcriptional regulator [Oleiagrimonas sp.]
METAKRSAFSIGVAAREAGVGVDTIRYYERQGLLPQAPRRPSGYREYGPDAVAQLLFIRRAKELGFSLDDIRELLALSTDREKGVAGVKARAQNRLRDVEQRIHELGRVQRGLKKLIEACPGHGDLAQCPILKSLASREDA